MSDNIDEIRKYMGDVDKANAGIDYFLDEMAEQEVAYEEKIIEANAKIEKLQGAIHYILGTNSIGDIANMDKSTRGLFKPLVDVLLETS